MDEQGLEPKTRRMSAAAFSHRGDAFAYGSAPSAVILRNLATAEILCTLPLDGEIPVVVAFDPRADLLACDTES